MNIASFKPVVVIFTVVVSVDDVRSEEPPNLHKIVPLVVLFRTLNFMLYKEPLPAARNDCPFAAVALKLELDIPAVWFTLRTPALHGT